MTNSEAMNEAIRTLAGRPPLRNVRTTVALPARSIRILRDKARDLGLVTTRGSGVERGNLVALLVLIADEIAADRLVLSAQHKSE